MVDGRGGFERDDGLAQVLALEVFDEDGAGPEKAALFAGGRFSRAEGEPAPGIARWDGEGWTPLAGGVGAEGRVLAMTEFDSDGPGPGDPELYVGGDFSVVDGKPAGSIARWDGSAWKDVPALGAPVRSLLVFDDDGPGANPERLYAAWYTKVMRLDGDHWTQIGDDLSGGGNNGVHVLASHDWDGDGPQLPTLYAGGSFDLGSIQEWTNIAYWDGTEWRGLGGGAGNQGPSSGVYTLAVHDDDADGPRPVSLFAGGMFYFADDLVSPHIARWDGTQWHVFEGMEYGYEVAALTVFDEDRNGPMYPALYFGGAFTRAGDASSAYIARWGCPPPPACYADCDGSGGLDLFDFLCFVNSFNAGHDAAECIGDGEFDLFDFLCFVNSFNAGC